MEAGEGVNRLRRWWHDLQCELRAAQAEAREQARRDGTCICPAYGIPELDHAEWCPYRERRKAGV